MKKLTFFALFLVFLGGLAWGQTPHTFIWGGSERTDNQTGYNWVNPTNWYIDNRVSGLQNDDGLYPGEINPNKDTVIFDNVANGTYNFPGYISIDTLQIDAIMTATISSTDSMNVNTLTLDRRLTLNSGTISVNNFKITNNVNYTSSNNAFRMNGATVTIATTTSGAITIEAPAGKDLTVGSIIAPGRVVTLRSDRNININGNIECARLIVQAGAIVTVANGVSITVTSSNNTHGNAAIWIEASHIIAIGSGTISTGANGLICLDVDTHSIDTGRFINGIEYCKSGTSLVPYPNHLVYGRTVPAGIPTLHTHIDSATNTETLFIVSPDYNVYIVDVGNSGLNLTFITSGSGFIEIRDVYSSSGDLTLISQENISFVGANVNLTGTGALSLTAGTDGVRLNNTTISLNTGFDMGTQQLTLFGSSGSHITAANITLDAIYGPDSLTLNASSGSVSIRTAGWSTPLGSLSVTGPITIGGNVTTTGVQTYNNAVTLGGTGATATRVLQGTNVTLGAITGGGNSLTVTGNAVFTGADNSGIAVLRVSGTSTIDGNITTTGNQTYTGAVILGNNITFTANAVSLIRFESTVNGDTNTRTLTVTTANARFDGVVGGGTGIASVSVAGTSAINTASITTTGDQTYTDAVTLGGTAGQLRTLEGTTVTMGAITGNNHPLTIVGNAVLNGGGGIGALQINGIGNTAVINGSITNTTSVTINATGTTAINAANITTTGNGTPQHYYGPVVLGANVTFTGGNNNRTIQFDSTVNGDNNTRTLTIATASASFNGEVGGGAGLTSVSVDGTTAINTAGITTTGAQTYTGAVTLGADVNFSATAENLIRFESTVRSSNTDPRTLTISAANVQFDGAVGIADNPISALTVTAGTAAINADITTTGNQSYAGEVTISGTGARKLESLGGIAMDTGLSSTSNDVTITANEITVGSGGLQASGNNVSLESSEDVTITSVITAETLTLAGNIVYELNNSGNNIAILQTAAPYPEEISYTDTDGFNIGTGLQAATNITLTADGAVTQGGEIITGTLTLCGNAGFTLNNAGNNIETLQTRAVLPNIYPTIISYTDADDFNIGTEGLHAVTRVALITAGKVTIEENINVTGSGVVPGNHKENAAVYIEADELEGDGAITFTLGSDHWVCAYITQSTGFTGDVNENGIHYHTTDGRHIVYRSGDSSTFTSLFYGNHPLFDQLYFYIPADDVNLHNKQDIYTTGTGNIYIVDVDNPSVTSNPALTRDITFTTESGGHIEIWGKYTAKPTGVLTLDPGSGGVVLIDAEISLDGNFDTNGTPLTAAGTSGSEINAANIILGGGIEGVSGSPSDLTLAAGTIHITGTAGSGTPVSLGDLTITGGLTLENTILSASSFTFDNGQIALLGDVELKTNNGDIEFNYNAAAPSITGSGNIVMTAGGGDVSILGQAGQSSSHIGGIRIISAGDVTFSSDVYAGTIVINNADEITLSSIVSSGNITINNSGLYTQNGNITVSGNFNQTGNGNVVLNGGITINNAAVIGFVSEITLGGSVAFNAPAGGTVRLKSVIDGSGSHTLTLNGGSAYSPLLVEQVNAGGININGSLIIAANSYVKINGGSTLTQNDNKGLTLGTNAVLDTSAASWHMGTAGTANDFAGINGTLILGENSKLITHNLNLTGNAFNITNTDWVTISVKGSAEITDDVTFSGDYPQLIIEMNGIGTQILTAEIPLGSLYVGTNSHTKIETGGLLAGSNPSTIIITGIVKIFAENALTAGLDAGDYDIVMYAGLVGNRNLTNYTHNGSNSIKYTRWENVSASIVQPPYTSPPEMNNFIFRQNTGRRVSFQRDPGDLTNLPVFFEIAGNTMWREFECSVPGAVVQFSRHPHHHVVLEDFSIGNKSSTAADHSDYVTITRLTDDVAYINFPYIYVSSMGQPPLTSAGANVGDLGSYALPVYYPPLDLKNSVSQEKEKYWNINFVTVSGPAQKPLDNFRYVRIFFSHAYNQRIPIETSSMHLDAVPYYRLLTGEGHFNFDWIELRKILYSFTEDSSGDGRLDRIRVQTNVRLNGDFSAFEVNVDGYQIDTSIGTNGFRMVNDLTGFNDDEDSFYIYLQQVPYIDGGSTPLWSVTRNESLKDLLTESSAVGDPAIDVDMRPFDTIPPRTSYTLTLPGHPQTYVRMSEPVLSLPGGNISDAQAVERSEAYIFTWRYFPYDGPPVVYTMPVISANMGYLLNIPSSFDIETLSRLSNIYGDTTSSEADGYFRMDNIIDQGQRAMDWHDSSVDPAFYIYYQPPKYPLNWAYTEYAKVYGNGHLAGRGLLTPDFSLDDTNAIKSDGSPIPISDVFMPPNKMLTVEMMTLIAQGAGDQVRPQNFASYSNPSARNSVIRRITDVLVSLAPAGGDSVNYFAWPVWARYQNNANPDNASLPDDFWSQRNTDNGVIWTFDGTDFLEARGYDLQARMNSGLTGSLELFWTTDIPTEYRIPREEPVRGRSTGGLWLPYPGDLHNNRLLYYFAPLYSGNAVNQTSASAPLYPPLFNFALNGENSSGKKMEFVFRINRSSPSDLFIARLDVPRGGAIPENWYTLVRPFGFDIQDIRLQRGGVTVLNNVINSDARENALIRYHLVRPGRVTVQVYTLDGTLVKSLRRNEYREAGEWTDAWDGSNNSGRAVARGMYFVRVVAPDIDEIRKIMVVR